MGLGLFSISLLQKKAYFTVFSNIKSTLLNCYESFEFYIYSITKFLLMEVYDREHNFSV